MSVRRMLHCLRCSDFKHCERRGNPAVLKFIIPADIHHPQTIYQFSIDGSPIKCQHPIKCMLVRHIH